MPRISLYGPNGGQVIDVPVPTQKGTITPPTPDPVKPTDSVHCKAVYAALRDMQTLFDTAGITEADYWSMVRSDLEIVSRTELSVSMWARLSATLNACRRDPAMFNRLVAKVKAHTAAQKSLTDASPVVFAEPTDTTKSCFVIRRDRITGAEEVVFVGELTDDVRKWCQARADESRCIIQLFFDGRIPEPYYPTTNRYSPL